MRSSNGDSSETPPLSGAFDFRGPGATVLKRSLRQRVLRAAERFIPAPVLVRRAPPNSTRQVALTFDDGPHELTRQFLDVLDQYNARATFFLVGSCCEDRREDVLEIVRRGHEVAGHGFSHSPFPTLGGTALHDELTRTDALLPPSRRSRSLVRPPYGAVSGRSLARCAAFGYTTVLWSFDSEDWRIHSARELVLRFKERPFDSGEIILMHEGYSWTLDALPKILEVFAQSHQMLVTVSELLGL